MQLIGNYQRAYKLMEIIENKRHIILNVFFIKTIFSFIRLVRKPAEKRQMINYS